MSANELSYLRSIVQEEDVEKMELARRNQSLKSVIQEEEDRFQHEIDFHHNVVDSLTLLMNKLDTLESKADIGILTACELWEKTQSQPVKLQEVANATLVNQETLKSSIAEQNNELLELNKVLSEKIFDFRSNIEAISKEQIHLQEIQRVTNAKLIEIEGLKIEVVSRKAHISEIHRLQSCQTLKLKLTQYIDCYLSEKICHLHQAMVTTAYQQEVCRAHLLLRRFETQQWPFELGQAHYALHQAETEHSTLRQLKTGLLVKLHHSFSCLESLAAELRDVMTEEHELTDQKQGLLLEKDRLQAEVMQLEAQWRVMRRSADHNTDQQQKASPSYFEEKYLTLQSEVRSLRERIKRNQDYAGALRGEKAVNDVSHQIDNCKIIMKQLQMVSLYRQYAACHLTEMKETRTEQRRELVAQSLTAQRQCEQLQTEVVNCEVECQEIHAECCRIEREQTLQREAAEAEKAKRAAAAQAHQEEVEAAQRRLTELQRTAETVKADLDKGREIRDKCQTAVERRGEEQRERLYQQTKTDRLEAVRHGPQAIEYQQRICEARSQLKKEDREYQLKTANGGQKGASVGDKVDDQKNNLQDSTITASFAAKAASPKTELISSSVPKKDSVAAAVVAALAEGQRKKHDLSTKVQKSPDSWRQSAAPSASLFPSATASAYTHSEGGSTRQPLQAGKTASVYRGASQQVGEKADNKQAAASAAAPESTETGGGSKRFKLQARMRS